MVGVLFLRQRAGTAGGKAMKIETTDLPAVDGVAY
jgi:hypothetical protein